MITKDIAKYAEENWMSERYYNTIAKISASKNDESLVDSPKKIFWLDNISSDLYLSKNNMPTSADGAIITDKALYLIEFKSGFKKKITKQNLDVEKTTCKHKDGICDDYWDLFFKKQKAETRNLIASIRDKAIESYITLEKRLFPKCIELTSDQKCRLEFVVVIDENELDNMESTLGDLCSKEPLSDNCFSDIRNSLKRCIKQKDANNHDYYYDEIKVMSSSDFISFIKNTCNLFT